jgi:hypothetical protein
VLSVRCVLPLLQLVDGCGHSKGIAMAPLLHARAGGCRSSLERTEAALAMLGPCMAECCYFVYCMWLHFVGTSQQHTLQHGLHAAVYLLWQLR